MCTRLRHVCTQLNDTPNPQNPETKESQETKEEQKQEQKAETQTESMTHLVDSMCALLSACSPVFPLLASLSDDTVLLSASDARAAFDRFALVPLSSLSNAHSQPDLLSPSSVSSSSLSLLSPSSVSSLSPSPTFLLSPARRTHEIDTAHTHSPVIDGCLSITQLLSVGAHALHTMLNMHAQKGSSTHTLSSAINFAFSTSSVCGSWPLDLLLLNTDNPNDSNTQTRKTKATDPKRQTDEITDKNRETKRNVKSRERESVRSPALLSPAQSVSALSSPHSPLSVSSVDSESTDTQTSVSVPQSFSSRATAYLSSLERSLSSLSVCLSAKNAAEHSTQTLTYGQTGADNIRTANTSIVSSLSACVKLLAQLSGSVVQHQTQYRSVCDELFRLRSTVHLPSAPLSADTRAFGSLFFSVCILSHRMCSCGNNIKESPLIYRRRLTLVQCDLRFAQL